MSSCTSERHEADKQSPAALASLYVRHEEIWNIGGAHLELFTCRRCHSTVCVPVEVTT